MPQDPHDKNPFELLGLTGEEDLPTIRKAFLRIATQSHPDQLRTKTQEEKTRALDTFLHAKKAFELLSQPDKRREWSEKLARAKPAAAPPPPAAPVPPPSTRPGPAPTPAAPPPAPAASSAPAPAAAPPPRTSPPPTTAALQLYKMGMVALDAMDYGKALDLFTKTAKLAPTPRHQAMELVCRGHQYLSTRFFDRARESFERALQLQPDCREAQQGLLLIDKQSGRYKRGR